MQYSQQCWTKAYSNLLNSTSDFTSTIAERDIERPFIALVFLPTEQPRSETIFSGFANRSITAPSCKAGMWKRLFSNRFRFHLHRFRFHRFRFHHFYQNLS